MPLKTKTTSQEVGLILGDLHMPFQHKRAVQAVHGFAKVLKPNWIGVLGDLIDLDQLYSKGPSFSWLAERLGRLQHDLDEAADFLAEWLWFDKVHVFEGNHEQRIAKYLRRGHGVLSGLRNLKLQHLLKVTEEPFVWHPWDKPWRVGKTNLYLTHGSQLKGESGQSAGKHIRKWNSSVLHGHSHRLGTYIWRAGPNRVLQGFENGCLCSLDPLYRQGPPDWHLGFSVVTVEGKHFQVEQVHLLPNHTYWWRGKLHQW